MKKLRRKLKKIIVNKEKTGNRIDKILSDSQVAVSRAAIQRMIENGKVLVNDKTTKASYKVQENDVINRRGNTTRNRSKTTRNSIRSNL